MEYKEGKTGQKGQKLEVCLFPAQEEGPEASSLVLALWGKAELASYKFHQCKCEECEDECGEVFVPEERAREWASWRWKTEQSPSVSQRRFEIRIQAQPASGF